MHLLPSSAYRIDTITVESLYIFLLLLGPVVVLEGWAAVSHAGYVAAVLRMRMLHLLCTD